MTVAVVVDSASDLPNELADALEIRRVPLNINIGGVEHKDGTELSREHFWELVRSSDQLPKTSAPSPAEWVPIVAPITVTTTSSTPVAQDIRALASGV
ncbi:MAG: DegV family protein [Actinobacteria bacterium]|nr:DegV family protein [Actinomycetota bacterium]